MAGGDCGDRQGRDRVCRFDFIRAVFSAQTAWRKAAAFRDLALGLAPGTSELQKGTKKTGASGWPSSNG
jgi:hypothetical protein